jgi:GNAT superfamily N-acetyltransferase
VSHTGMNNLNLKTLTEHQEGTFFNLLSQSYIGFDKIYSEYTKSWINDWKKYDNEIFNKPDTVGNCGFVTYLENVMIGFASWDSRQFPIGIIGHNCILPRFRGHGYGQEQIKEIINRFKKQFFTKAVASTLDHDFFSAAHNMYLTCGFKEKRKYTAKGSVNKIIEYEKIL